MTINISGGSGFQFGDGNTQINVVGDDATVQPVEAWWSDVWLPGTEPALTQAMVLAGRQAAAEEFRTALQSDQVVVAIGGDLGVTEFKAFIAAALVGGPFANRSFFISGATALTIAGSATEPPIVMFAVGTEPAGLPLTGFHRIVLFGRRAAHPLLTVPAVDGQAVARQLAASPAGHDRELRLGPLARRGLEHLRRTLSRYPQLPEAGWSVNPDRTCRRLSLLGEFTDQDSALFADFADLDPAGLQDKARHLLTDPERPLFGRLGSLWYLQDPQDAFLLLRDSFTAADLDGLAELAVRLFRDREPSAHPSRLRRGVARTLLLLSVHGEDLQYGPAHRRASDLAEYVVREILADISSSGWAALSDVIVTLAEAAPDAFLEAMSPAVDWHTAMFTSDQDYPAFLWTLELLARPTRYFNKAVAVLAQLAAADPGGQLSNRPAASLVGVFDCRIPQTMASRVVRGRALRRIVQAHPEVGRVLMRDLLPHGSVLRTRHPEPQFRQWPLPGAATADEAYRAFQDVAVLAIEHAGTDPGRCEQLIPSIDAMPSEQRVAFLQVLADLPVPVDRVPRRGLFEALTALAVRHRQYADMPWALPEDQIAELDRVATRFRPDHAADRHHWLFAEQWPDRSPGDDITGCQLEQARTDAVVEILAAEDGFQALLALADETGNGDLIGGVLPRQTDEGPMMAWLTGDRDALAFEYFATQIRNGSPARRAELLALAGDPGRKAAILLASHDPGWALEQLPVLGEPTGDVYWRKYRVRALGPDRVVEIADGLCGVHRFPAALDLICLYAKAVDTPALAWQALVAAEGFVATASSDPEAHRVSRYSLQILIDLLAQHLDHLDRRRVVGVELGLSGRLSVLDPKLPVTTMLMEQEPAVFADLAITSLRGTTYEARAAALRAVRAFNRCPGCAPNTPAELNTLLLWVRAVRERFAEADLQVIGDQTIAGVIVHAIPAAFDVVGDLVEEISSDDLDHGISIALYNRRGLVVRGLDEGGGQERKLAGHYRDLAGRSGDYPRLQSVLLQLAEQYTAEARVTDAEAEAFLRHL
ncbi:hypothetical protein [Actinoplanes aureus]|uniref:Uncharacterized protein n=1 Tax=Actinoplanes aureus TaxID=2792083 RepID=A0A931CI57_9ACTN|nr:hypothetical protein [Actinoplanes aureus]MBG0568442.1 hypothetical protein [Actinoplanes aureus]